MLFKDCRDSWTEFINLCMNGRPSGVGEKRKRGQCNNCCSCWYKRCNHYGDINCHYVIILLCHYFIILSKCSITSLWCLFLELLVLITKTKLQNPAYHLKERLTARVKNTKCLLEMNVSI